MKKNKRTIILKLSGDKITADKLRNSIGAFYGFIDEIASQISGTKKPIKWIVSVRKGSVVLVNEAEEAKDLKDSVTDKIFDSIQDGINTLEQKTERPPYYTDRALEYLQDLATIPITRKNGITGININIDKKLHKLTPHVIANVDSILGVSSKGLGSVEGKLQTLSERGSPKFIIYDSLTDKPIRCNITDDLIYDATKAFGKRVYVFGMISYDQIGSPKNIKVQELKIFDESTELPNAFEICGLLEG